MTEVKKENPKAEKVTLVTVHNKGERSIRFGDADDEVLKKGGFAQLPEAVAKRLKDLYQDEVQDVADVTKPFENAKVFDTDVVSDKELKRLEGKKKRLELLLGRTDLNDTEKEEMTKLDAELNAKA